MSRVLLADRSAAIRAVLRRALASEPGLEVVGEARDGRELASLLLSAEPEVVVMDVDLPELGGDGAWEEIFGKDGPPIVVVTSLREPSRTSSVFRFLRRRVVGVFAKPTAPARWDTFGSTLRETLGQLVRQHGPPGGSRPLPRVEHGPLHCVAVGASTGGPAALAELLSSCRGECSAPLVVVQHIAAGFEAPLARWLGAESGLDVQVARDGEKLEAPAVRLAPSGVHLVVDAAGVSRLDPTTPASNGHRPSVDVLFRSLLAHRATEVAAVLLSGMGSDGVAAMAELRRAGALTLAQSESSCAMWGMPRAAVERGAASYSLAPADIAAVLCRASRRVTR